MNLKSNKKIVEQLQKLLEDIDNAIAIGHVGLCHQEINKILNFPIIKEVLAYREENAERIKRLRRNYASDLDSIERELRSLSFSDLEILKYLNLVKCAKNESEKIESLKRSLDIYAWKYMPKPLPGIETIYWFDYAMRFSDKVLKTPSFIELCRLEQSEEAMCKLENDLLIITKYHQENRRGTNFSALKASMQNVTVYFLQKIQTATIFTSRIVK